MSTPPPPKNWGRGKGFGDFWPSRNQLIISYIMFFLILFITYLFSLILGWLLIFELSEKQGRFSPCFNNMPNGWHHYTIKSRKNCSLVNCFPHTSPPSIKYGGLFHSPMSGTEISSVQKISINSSNLINVLELLSSADV